MNCLDPVIRVGKQIMEMLLEHEDMDKKQAYDEAVKLLKVVGIPDPEIRMSSYLHQLSGGMCQRVMIAIALACKPKLLLADEPTTALDVTIQAQVIKMIKDLRDQFNMALILITHDLGVVADIADDVAVVYAGEIVEYGSKEDIYLHPKHPYTKALFNAIPNLETDVDRLENIKGLPPDPAQLPEGCCFSPRCTYAVEACTRAKSAPVSYTHLDVYKRQSDSTASFALAPTGLSLLWIPA